MAPASKAAKKGKKKKGGADSGPGAEVPQEASQAGGDQELDPEKAAKKVRVGKLWVESLVSLWDASTCDLLFHSMQAAKLAEKAAKDAKFAAKQAALNAAKQAEAEKNAAGANDKKAAQKAEAEAKKVS